MTIRILIADDHGVVAEGLRSLIEAQADMKVVAVVEDGREAEGRHHLSGQLTESLIDHVAHKAASEEPLQRLSSRERQVLQCSPKDTPSPESQRPCRFRRNRWRPTARD